MKARAITPQEIEAIRAYLAGSKDHYAVRDMAMFEIGINCGLRISEVLALNVSQVFQHGSPAARVQKPTVRRLSPLADGPSSFVF